MQVLRNRRGFSLICLALAGDARATFPAGEGLEMRIATPVCGLVRNDMRYTRQRIYLSFFIRFSSRPD